MSKGINPRDKEGRPHGLWERHWDNGYLDYKGSYVNGKTHGFWEEYYGDGSLYSKRKFINGVSNGYREISYDGIAMSKKFYLI